MGWQQAVYAEMHNIQNGSFYISGGFDGVASGGGLGVFLCSMLGSLESKKFGGARRMYPGSE